MYDITIKKRKPEPVASIRTSVKREELGPTIEQLLPEVWQYLDRLDVLPAGPPFVRYHSRSKEQMDVEIGLSVAAPIAGEGRIQSSELPGGTVAVTWHTGPYTTLEYAFEALDGWINEHSQEKAGPPWEFYWTDAEEAPNPKEWKTQVLWPIK